MMAHPLNERDDRARKRRVWRWWVARSSDATLDRVLRLQRTQHAVMRSLAASFRPEHARGFAGAIAFELERLRDPERAEVWTVVVDGDEAVAIPGAGDAPPALTVRTPAVDLLRVVAGDVGAADPFTSGRAALRGRLLLASRLPEMFDLRPPAAGAQKG